MADAGRTTEELRLIRRAAREGVADGLRKHLPGGIGILIKGGATIALCAMLHLLFGVTLVGTVVGGGVGGVGLAVMGRGQIDD